ncbi:MAG: phage portal protein [Anaerolineaceae bacterium]|nr:phage portal protein [Anaerolineaceae bacterium]
MTSLRERLQALFQSADHNIESAGSRTKLSLPEQENSLWVGSHSFPSQPRDRDAYDRQAVLQDSLEAWRFNPLARRIVELTTQYATGGGLQPNCQHKPTQEFIENFWNHRLNRMENRVREFSDELCLSGNLFLLLSTDQSGMSYLRVLPSTDVVRIESSENDIEQELAFYLRLPGETEELVYRGYDPQKEEVNQQGRLGAVVLHYAVNRPSGSQWGEGDLTPILKWLARYSAWLEDRVRLNRFRNAFVYVVKARFGSETDRSARQLQLAANPPAPGSVLVTDESEEWSVLAPKLEALDASSDGLAIKKMIAAGVGLPLHFLAEPESSTRTTAEAAGSPTYRRFSERQRVICALLEDVLRVVVSRRACFDPGVDCSAPIRVEGGDVSARDNRELAQAGQQVAQVAGELYQRELIDEREVLRLVYRFMGERLPEPAQAAKDSKSA